MNNWAQILCTIPTYYTAISYVKEPQSVNQKERVKNGGGSAQAAFFQGAEGGQAFILHFLKAQEVVNEIKEIF